MVYDMTQGKPLRLIMVFALPMLIGNIFQQVYNFVDAAVVGRFVGASSLAAVGATSTLMSIMICLMMGLTNGAGVIISQCCGAREFDKLRSTVTTLIYIVACLAVVTAAAGILLAPSVLRLLNTPEDILDEAVLYIRTIFLFTAGTAAYNVTGAVLRSLGDSRTPLYALIVSSIINICLDLLFVTVFHFGVAGVAAATGIAQIASAVFCIVHIVRYREQLNLTPMPRKASLADAKSIFRTGIPGALESCLISLGTMSVQRLVNSCGTMTMAGYTAATKIDSVAIYPVVTVGNALSVFSGQNIGAGQIGRIKKGMYQTLAALMLICLCLAVLIVTFRRQLLGLFLDVNEAAEAVEIGGRYLTIVCFAYFVAAVMRTYLNVLRGAGDVNISALSGITELAGRIVFAYILVKPLGSTGIWLATPLAWAAGAAVPVIRYYSGKWMNKKLV